MIPKYIQEQAVYYANIPKMDPRYKASVHLEDVEDEMFWNAMLQQVLPGEYNFISHSRSKKGNDTRGCEQCLKYVGCLSKLFFVCIDSDLRNIVGKNQYSAEKFVAQTYAYSWENHLCHAQELQQRFIDVCAAPKLKFDFLQFLSCYSKVLYRALELLVHEEIHGNKDFFKKIISVLPKQYRSSNMLNNGEPYCRDLMTALDELEKQIDTSDLSNVEQLLQNMGITPENAYLYMRGHDVYDLIRNIGEKISENFEKDVLQKSFATSGYPEIQKVNDDLRTILKTEDE